MSEKYTLVDAMSDISTPLAVSIKQWPVCKTPDFPRSSLHLAIAFSGVSGFPKDFPLNSNVESQPITIAGSFKVALTV
ncbi:unannotated protein [freshwater metagenome]|uniref:Unannotated protein n=1 Tax=freshwater metagenome TaxID=449393 RepID=A0A6J6WSJ9_9ZZZZ